MLKIFLTSSISFITRNKLELKRRTNEEKTKMTKKQMSNVTFKI